MVKDNLQNFLQIINDFSDSIREEERSVRKSRVASDGSQPNPFKEVSEFDLLSLISMDYQLTVRLKNSTLTRRQISILLAILNYQSCYFGLNFGMYLGLDYLSGLLIGNKSEPLLIKDKFERETVFVTQIILSSIGGQELSLKSLTEVPRKLTESFEENHFVMSRRTYGSRFSTYKPENLLQILAVPLDIFMNRENGKSEPYSSYCKGYGESHPNARNLKTKPSFELDGETREIDYLHFADIQNQLILNQLELRYKMIRMRRKA